VSDSLESQRLKSAVKALLKQGGHRYEDLAAVLGVSLPTVRRILTKDDLSVDRMAQICRWLGITFKELVELAEKERATLTTLTEEQEHFFAAFPRVYAYLRCLGAGMTPTQIEGRFGLLKTSSHRYLADLSALGLIEEDRAGAVRLLIPWPASWRFPGPLQATFGSQLFRTTVDHLEEQAANPALKADYGKTFFFFLDLLRLTPPTYKEYVREMVELFRKYTTLGRFEAKTRSSAELVPCAAILGIDRWDAMAAVLGDPRGADE